ncbi:hypothetical protein AU15_06390 [Marinobacter salarius]|uniref:Uncharacterized protein n=1 Tax=Marinobacter salarius TaxID=1420917 RepID=W5Z3L1_9GAMM|nr:hypothetical protein AU15_06390 [Marinobacter salarius]
MHEGFLYDIGQTGIELHHDPLTLDGMELRSTMAACR